MAYSDTESMMLTRSAVLIKQIRRIPGALAKRASQRAEFRRAINELSMYSDRDLADLNIARCNIPRVAREAIYGR